MVVSQHLSTRLREQVVETPECHYWFGTTTADDLAVCDGVPVVELVWWSRYGPVPVGMRVTARCGCPRCVNPAHLGLVIDERAALRESA